MLCLDWFLAQHIDKMLDDTPAICYTAKHDETFLLSILEVHLLSRLHLKEEAFMHTLPSHFQHLLSAIEPQKERAEMACDLPAQVREYLARHPDIKTIAPYTRLAGSYGRHTAIKHIKDVDILVFVDPSYKDLLPKDILNPLSNVLHSLPEELENTSGPVNLKYGRRSVHVHLERADFDLDIVPVIIESNLSQPLAIPDKGWGYWVTTHPLGYGQLLSDLNAKHRERVVPLIKLFKHWRDERMKQHRPKSYWLECLVYHCFAENLIPTENRSYAEMFAQILDVIYEKLTAAFKRTGKVPTIDDPALGQDVAFSWTLDAYQAFIRRLEESIPWAKQALTQKEIPQAVQYWQKMFGKEWFPDETEEQKMGQYLAAAVKEKHISINQTGRISLEKPVVSAIQPLPQRFYGDN